MPASLNLVWIGAIAVSLAACVAPAGPVHGNPATPLLYVANGLDGTIQRLDAATGRPVGPPLPAGNGPQQIVVGPNGSLLVASVGFPSGGQLTHLTRIGSRWVAHPVSLKPGAREPLIAAGGGRHAVVAFRAAAQGSSTGAAGQPPRCLLSAIDLVTGHIERPRAVCSGRDSVVALAAGPDPGAGDASVSADAVTMRTYLAIQESPAAGEECSGVETSRIVALDATTGATVGVIAIDGALGPLSLGLAPGGTGQRLYAARATTSPSTFDPIECLASHPDDPYFDGSQWDLLDVDPVTLAVEAIHLLPQPPRWFAVAPDGEHAYGLAGWVNVLHVNLIDGTVGRLTQLPDMGFGLVVGQERVYVADLFGDAVWDIDRRDGRLRRHISVGHRPLGLAMEGGSAALHPGSRR